MLCTRFILRKALKVDGRKILLRGLATEKRQRRTGLSAAQEKEIVRENWELRCQLATAYRAFEKFGMSEGICNHLTAKAPSLFKEEGIALLVPYGLYWSQVTPECFVGIDLKTAEVIEGLGREPETTAFSIHLGVYDARPDVQCVMHTHPTYSTTLSVLKDPTIQMIGQNATRFRSNVAYDTSGYDGIANQGENTEGKRLGKALGDKAVLMMGNHGLLTVGETIPTAYDLHYYFERAAETQVLAYQTGKPLSYLSDEVARRTEEAMSDFGTKGIHAKHLEALKNVFVKEDPSFIDPAKSEYMEYVG